MIFQTTIEAIEKFELVVLTFLCAVGKNQAKAHDPKP